MAALRVWLLAENSVPTLYPTREPWAKKPLSGHFRRLDTTGAGSARGRTLRRWCSHAVSYANAEARVS